MRRNPLLALTAALLALLGAGSIAATDNIAHIASQFTWQRDDPGFGGFSAIELSADGTGFYAVSDRGSIVSGRLIREGGTITGVESGPITPLRAPAGRAFRPGENDSEGLAIGADGALYISFEGAHRVLRYESPGAVPLALPRHPDFAAMQGNSSLEALAIGPDGELYTMPERSGALRRPFPVYRFQGGHWEQPFTIARRGQYLPVGADFGPDGRFYLLERNFAGLRGLFGFSTRIRRFTLGADGFENEEVLYESQFASLGNLEGISVWQDGEGQIRLTMIADDNFRALQSTEIVELIVSG